jgi:diguanylate cyclase (GGDEF)-like protein
MTSDKSLNQYPGNIDEKAGRFFRNLQSKTSIEEVWGLFLKTIIETISLESARLIYRSAVMSKFLVTTFNKEKPVTTESDVKHAKFLETAGDFDHTFSEKEIVIFKRADGYFVQFELCLANPSAAVENKLIIFSQIIMNQIILLMRIGNLEFHSIKDDITLAYNQKYLRTFMQHEIERCRRYPSVFSIVFFDLDNLKAVNEKFGHLVGTQVLKEVAAVLRQQVRKIDLLSRFGGDEFVIVLLKTNATKTFEICSRIKQNLDSTVFLNEKSLNIKMTGCFGISSFPQNGNSVEELIKKADSAMYEMKRKGKNGIKIYEGV